MFCSLVSCSFYLYINGSFQLIGDTDISIKDPLVTSYNLRALPLALVGPFPWSLIGPSLWSLGGPSPWALVGRFPQALVGPFPRALVGPFPSSVFGPFPWALFGLKPWPCMIISISNTYIYA